MKAYKLFPLGLSILGLLFWIFFPGSAGFTSNQPNQDSLGEHASLSDNIMLPTRTEVDDADSHKWIGESWGDDIYINWDDFASRKTLRARVTPTGHNWATMRTDAFPVENWETMTGLRADVYQLGGASGVDIKLEVRGPSFDPPDLIESIYCYDLQPDAWNTCTWVFLADLDYNQVAYLSVVFDHLGGTATTFYVDNLRLVIAGGESEWDDMDDGSREWFPWGNWYAWNPDGPFGRELISHKGQNPETPAGSIYLQWDYERGCCYPGTTAEAGTHKLADLTDWGGYNRITADIRVSDPDVPISVFLWDSEGITTTIDCRGFGTPTRKTGTADTWQTITWDLPWPPCFNQSGIDELKFVVNNIDTYQTGTFFLDNIALISDTMPSMVSGLEYVLEDFNNRNGSFNHFSGNWGEINGDLITTTFVTNTYAGARGASLRVDYSLPSQTFTGIWESLWGHSDYTQTQFINFTDIYGNLNEANKDFEQIHFWVRGSGNITGTHNIKIELKDNTNDYNRTAYRYLTIDDSGTTWQEIILDADVTNASFWSYNDLPPDPARIKQMVLVIESFFNNPTGTFYLDDIHFVDADDQPFDLSQHTNDEFLDLVSQKTFLYFLDWYDSNTGLFQDQSITPDLMSTAATGFGLTALTIGESRGWIQRSLAVEMITRTLHTLYDGQSPADTVTDTITNTNGYKGFFYHFLGANGLRKDSGSELSSVDTAILMFGILTVKEYFNDNQEIVDLADQIYGRIDWEWMLDTSNNLFYHAWKPEQSPGYLVEAPGGGYFTNVQWDYYTDEVILINMLAIGSPTHPTSTDIFYAWERNHGAYDGHNLIHSWNGSFFTYIFAHLWIDFRVLGIDNHPSQPVDWWINSIEAAWANWQFVVDHQDDEPCNGDSNYVTYNENSWGLTAAAGPYEENNYHAYGALPADPDASIDHDGTIASYGAGMATILLPEKAIPALKNYFSHTALWNYRFGYGDAYNLDTPDCMGAWYNHASFGIDQGPLLISIENSRSGLIWSTIKRNTDISRAINEIFPPTQTNIPTPTQTNTPTSTNTATPTNTPSPTSTATPSQTQTITTTPTNASYKLFIPHIIR